MKTNILEIANIIRSRYGSSNTQLIITVTPDGFKFEKKPYPLITDAPDDAADIQQAPAIINESIGMPRAAYNRNNGRKSQVPTGDTILSGSHTSKWWSRYHFEKNLMTLAFNKMTEENPATRFISTRVASMLTSVMGLTISTAKRHITRSIKMGILLKEKEGNITWLSLNEPQPVEKEEVNDDNINGDGQGSQDDVASLFHNSEEQSDEFKEILP